jgi:hypothetical protein
MYRLRDIVSLVTSLALIPTGLSSAAFAQDSPAGKIMIEILEGDGAVNNIKQRTAREPIVQVTDENHKPIAGAIILFTAPDKGAGALFNGAKTLSVTTDAQGRAAAQGFQTNGIKGNFEIKVHASFQNQTADATLKQVNVRPGPIVGGKTIWVVAAVAAAALTTALILTNTGGSSTNPTVLSPGAPSVGGPH